METLTIRISRRTHSLLRELAEETNTTMAEVVDQAIRDYQRKKFWEDYQAAYAAIQADPSARDDLRHEVEMWDTTLDDGLEEPENERGAER